MNKTFGKIIMLTLMTTLLANCKNTSNSSSSGYDEEKEDLQLYFPFEEEKDNQNVIIDKISNRQYNLQYVFKDAAWTSDKKVERYEGVKGTALNFDGNSIYAELSPLSFNENNFSLSMFVAPRAFERNDGAYNVIFSNLGVTGGIEISMSNYGYWKVIVGTTKGQLQAILTDTPLQLYQWNHICVIYSKKDNKIYIYQDGVNRKTIDLKGGSFINSSESIYLGRNKDPMTTSAYEMNYFNGLMDEIKVFNNQLDKKDISEICGKKDGKNSNIWYSYSLLADDRYLPQYHMRGPVGWTNEHYGGFYYNGQYHIFNQLNPFRAFYQNGQRWGHLTSSDLVHWESQYPALVCEENGIDNSNCFSGCATFDQDGKPVIFYTGVNEKKEFLNSISYAKPDNLEDSKLVKWNKSNKKVIEQGSFASRGEFRDPFIYKENGKTFMLIGGDNGSNGAAYIYKATDNSLENWEALGICYSGSTSQYPVLGTTYELPNLFKLSSKDGSITKYMLMISPIRTYNGVYYWLGNFNLDTGVFTPDNEEPQRIDVGPKNKVLAASGFFDTHKNRNIITTMIRTNMNDADAKLSCWNSGQTLWKEIYLDNNGRLCLKPIEEYASLEKETLLSLENVNLNVSQADSLFSAIHSDSYKIEIEIEPNGDNVVGLSVKCGERGEKVTASYTLSTSQFYVDNSRGSFDMKTNGSGGGTVAIDGSTIKLTIYVDRSLVEAYLDDKNEISVYTFNKYKESNSLKMYSDKNNAIIKKIKIVQLSDAYGQNKEAYWED